MINITVTCQLNSVFCLFDFVFVFVFCITHVAPFWSKLNKVIFIIVVSIAGSIGFICPNHRHQPKSPSATSCTQPPHAPSPHPVTSTCTSLTAHFTNTPTNHPTLVFFLLKISVLKLGEF